MFGSSPFAEAPWASAGLTLRVKPASVSASGQVGSLKITIITALEGHEAAARAGSVAADVGTIVVGHGANCAVGSITATGGAHISLDGHQATADVGVVRAMQAERLKPIRARYEIPILSAKARRGPRIFIARRMAA